MARRPSPHPTDGELEILQVLWDQGPSNLGTICDTIRRRRQVATTTVATMLKLMLQKQLVERSPGQRGYIWSAAVSRQTAASELISKVLNRVFDGSAQRLVSHLVEMGQLDSDELDDLRELLASDKAAKTPRKKR